MKIDSSLYLSNQSETQSGSNRLGKDAFLQILMTQLANQSPLDPMKDKDFIAQMATFSQLEQLTNLSGQFEEFFWQQNDSNFLQYTNLIGKEVGYVKTDEDGEMSQHVSVVTSVKREGQDIFLKLENGETIHAFDIYQVDLVNGSDEVSANESQN